MPGSVLTIDTPAAFRGQRTRFLHYSSWLWRWIEKAPSEWRCWHLTGPTVRLLFRPPRQENVEGRRGAELRVESSGLTVVRMGIADCRRPIAASARRGRGFGFPGFEPGGFFENIEQGFGAPDAVALGLADFTDDTGGFELANGPDGGVVGHLEFLFRTVGQGSVPHIDYFLSTGLSDRGAAPIRASFPDFMGIAGRTRGRAGRAWR